MNHCLGKLPARPGAISFKFSKYFKVAALPTPPAVFGHQAIVNEWGVLGNDQYGCCVLSGGDHESMLWTAEAGTVAPFNDSCALSDYSAITGFNPADPATDQGTDMQAAASYRRTTGLIDANGVRHKVDAYVAPAVGDVNELMAATYLFGAVGFGFQFPASAMTQFNAGQPWSVVPGSPIEGGHYVPCLRGETLISLLDGRNVPIGELAALGKNQWVYAIDKSHRVVPALATNIRQTGRGRSLVRIHLDDGSSFDCTNDHLIMLRDGYYLAAGLLTEGASLMPLYRRLSDGSYHKMFGYEEIMDPCSNEWVFTHWRVTEEAVGRRWGVVHHDDRNKRNNSPNNLIRMSWDAHRALHAADMDALTQYVKSEKGRDRSRQLMTDSWADEDRRKRHINHLKTNPKLAAHRKAGFFDKAAQSQNGKKTGPINIKLTQTPEAKAKKVETQRERLLTDPAFREKKAEIARQNGSKVSRLTREQIIYVEERLKNAPIGRNAELADELCVSRSVISRIKNGPHINHKVVAIEVLPGVHDVYDMEVPKYHNFAIGSGVFVHNCVGRRANGNLVCVTWGALQEIEPSFAQSFNDESVAYLSLESLKNSISPENFDLATLQADLNALPVQGS
jgi:hypothetical protein